MADKILIKRSLTTGAVPTTASLQEGELALNIPDRKLYTLSGSAVVTLGTTGSYQATQLDLVAVDKIITVEGTTLTNVFNETALIDPLISAVTYSGAAIEYNAQRENSARFGKIMASWSGSNLVYTDNSTNDIGDTSDLSFNLIRIGDDIRARAYSAGVGSGGWNISFTFTLFPNLL